MAKSEAEEFISTFKAALSVLGVPPDREVVALCRAHYELLLEVNETTNLTRVTCAEDAAQKHYADSLLPLCFGLLPQGARVLDIGSGAGFPGVPLALFRPDISVTLLDSQIKRADFLRRCALLIPQGADVVHARSEDASRQADMRMAFDVVVSRALAPLPVLLELSLPFIKDGGVAIAYKGPKANEELELSESALKKLGGEAKLLRYDAPWGARSLVVVTKRGAIADEYPRKAGIPQRSPL